MPDRFGSKTEFVTSLSSTTWGYDEYNAFLLVFGVQPTSKIIKIIKIIRGFIWTWVVEAMKIIEIVKVIRTVKVSETVKTWRGFERGTCSYVRRG